MQKEKLTGARRMRADSKTDREEKADSHFSSFKQGSTVCKPSNLTCHTYNCCVLCYCSLERERRFSLQDHSSTTYEYIYVEYVFNKKSIMN